jgi:non-homologous end joining protein Ku
VRRGWARGGKIEVPERDEEPSNVINLMDALRQSVGKKGRRRSQPRARRTGKAHHRKAA